MKRIFRFFQSFFNKNKSSKDSDVLHLAFILQGGIGDILISLAFIEKLFFKLPKNTVIDLFAHNTPNINHVLFYNNDLFNVFLRNQNFDAKNYDLVAEILRYPNIQKIDKEHINNKSKFLANLCMHWEQFKLNHKKFLHPDNICATQADIYSLLNDINRNQQPDIDRILNISKEERCFLDINYNSVNVLDKYHLNGKKYITIHRGHDSNNNNQNSTKLWPVKYYSELVKLIKRKYPDLIIIQLGVSESRCPIIENIDINLVGKTSFNDIIILLKHSCLHVDGEGGFSHLCHLLYSTSVVLFGPTPIEFYRYSKNINIKGNGCNYWCEKVLNNWQEKCARGYNNPPCMYSIYPQQVFKEIYLYLNKKRKMFFKELKGLDLKKCISTAKHIICTQNTRPFLESFSQNFSFLNLNAKHLQKDDCWGSIYNIPYEDSTCDIFITAEIIDQYAQKEICRILTDNGLWISLSNNHSYSSTPKFYQKKTKRGLYD